MVIEWPTGTDVVTVALHERVAVITFNRPERRNALHHEMYEPITRALAEFAGARRRRVHRPHREWCRVLCRW